MILLVVSFGVLEEGGVDAATMAPNLTFGCQHASKSLIFAIAKINQSLIENRTIPALRHRIAPEALYIILCR
ncbi:hypothetical protein D1920_23290 [Rhodopseudomonas palustris]|nr:hypothetical protein D1920_23290 [Rhodopseudomonas palustris]